MTRLTTINLRRIVPPALLAIATIALGGASCDKGSSTTKASTQGAVVAMDNADKASKPIDKTPIPGADLSKLDATKDASKIDRFYRLVDTLPSPCGKAHSLRKSVTEDKTCKRGTFAVRYVVQLLSDEQNDAEVTEFYELHYTKKQVQRTFTLNSSVPHHGPVDAPVQVVEFYDYGCPACKQFAPIIDEAMSEFTNEAALFYKQFPLPGHKHSKPAAQAALAAMKQGKFDEMHKALFSNQPNHQKPLLVKYANAIGLDLARFESDYESAAAQVDADVKEGDQADVHSTPSIFINGRQYEGPAHPTYLRMWIQEEFEVNR